MTRTRMTASERGEQVLAAAVTAFAESGYAATKTDEIARRAGVSQPYVIRLFGTKQQLFLAALRLVCDRIEDLFRTAAEQIPADATVEEALEDLGAAYRVLLTERDLPRVLLHGFSASGDPAIGPVMRARFGEVYQLVRDLTGASASEAGAFIATGMLLTDMAAMQVVGPDAVETPWATEILTCINPDL
ncbi:TetR/AcrR family transcriptional regulator [Nocardia acidivorans]|uniref:TetR/AcrR family transcriptional regulator n=1 Tax=Nocardia acidivorans TaxID=404580 RepID=UPI00083194D3|nr:TetR/AcrR family transcriptional regulator [Nocardia acidivorans]